MIKTNISVTAAILTLAFGHSAAAHDFFLVPSSYRLNAGDSVKIAIHVSEYFPGESVKWSAARVLRFHQYSNIRRDRFTVTLIDDLLELLPTGDSSGVIVTPAQEGTYLFVLNWSARHIELEPTLFHQYLRAEGLDEILELREVRGESRKPGRERYSRYVKTFLQVGDGVEEDWSQVVGQKIEIVPEKVPTSLQAGDTLTVQVLFDGIPLHRVLVSATYAGYTTNPDTYEQSMKTDTHGRARFVMTHDGSWLVRLVHMVPLEADPEADWESFWASMTFPVKK